MADREKVIKGVEILMNGCEYIHCDDCCFYISTKPTRCGLREEQIQEDALALLKEQEDMGKELTDAMELVHKKNARIIELTDLLKEQEAVVRCKDCIHRGKSEKCVLAAISEEKDFPLFMLDNRGGWFCADGERRETDG